MFFIVKRLDPKKKPERIRMSDVETYREFCIEDNTSSKMDGVKTVLFFYKSTNKQPVYSSMTIDELDDIFKPVNK